MTSIPTLPDGRHDWSSFVKTIKPGDTIVLPKKYMGTAPKCIAAHGFQVSVSVLSGNLVITIRDGQAPPKKTERRTTIHQAEARHNNIPARHHEALQNLKYWQEQKHLAPTQAARTEASARVAAWTIQRDHLKAQLDARKLTTSAQ
jgi:hypothetical protein